MLTAYSLPEYERTFGKRKAVLDVVHFLDRLSYEQYVLASCMPKPYAAVEVL